MLSLFRFAHRLHRLRTCLTRPLTVGVRLILVRGDQVLLVRHTYQPGWMLPGGGVEKGETLEQAARREASEETGVELGALELHGVYTNFYEQKSDHVVVFACRSFSGPVARPNLEIECLAFFPLDALPGDLVPGHRRRLEEFLTPGRAPGFGMW